MPDTPEITRANLLAVIRRADDYARLGENDDERLLLRTNIMPRSILLAIFGASAPDSLKGRQIEEFLDKLVIERKLLASRTYLKNNPRGRTRPIATNYVSDRPKVTPGTRNPVTYRIFGRDRLLLWAAAANHDFSGSKGEARGLFLILKFFRKPNVQRLWRKFIERPTWKLPENTK
jgi:hypothetical protein